VLDQLVHEQPIDLLGHSMGGNVVMLYAGLRPTRIRKLVNLEGFGMPRVDPSQAAKRFVQWLDDLKSTHALKPYLSCRGRRGAPAEDNPLLRGDRAAWLARQWARQAGAPGEAESWELLADPAHKRSTPVLYHVEDVLESGSRSARRCCGSKATRPTSGAGGASATRRPSSKSA
jgi:pimeloyl-ACP methyl ester carboxylesterase